MLALIQYTLLYAAVLLLVALGGCFSEHSGVINIGLEGIMVMGALGGALVMRYLPYVHAEATVFGQIGMFGSVLIAAVVFGAIYSLLLAVACINLKADQTIVGTAMNLLGTALSTVIVKALNVAASPDDKSSKIIYADQKKAFVSNVAGFELHWFMIVTIILLGVSVFLLYKTRFGLRLRACGEHPQAADSVGISVYKMRYAGVLLSGVLGGLGGITYITCGVSEWQFENGVAGFGFLALAVMIFGAWDPMRIAGSALIFGFFRALGRTYNGIHFLVDLQDRFEIAGNVASAIYNMLPYIVCLIVLSFTSKNSRAPKAEGIPYDKGQR